MRRSLWPLALVIASAEAAAGEKPLVIPQEEGARQGRIVGRALACGLPGERADAVLRAGRERMLAAVGRTFTEDRYGLERDRALTFETSLPRPSEAACARATAAFERLERGE